MPTDTPMQLGMVGLGRMGAGIVRRLMRDGHSCVGYDIHPDAVAAVRLLGKLVAGWPQMAGWKLETLHRNQVEWRREQQDGLRAFFEKVGKEHDGMCPAWPLHTAACAGAHRVVVSA